LPAKRPKRSPHYSRLPSPASRLVQVRGEHASTPNTKHCRSWLASEEARKVNAMFEDAFAGKPAPTGPRCPRLHAQHKPLYELACQRRGPKDHRNIQGRHRRQAGSYRSAVPTPPRPTQNIVGAGLPAMRPERSTQYSKTPSPASRLVQVRGEHASTPNTKHCRSWLASEEARKITATFKAAIAGKPAPTGPRRPRLHAQHKTL
jgi:hypothetical protein